MGHTKVMAFILLLMAVIISSSEAIPTGTPDTDQGQTTAEIEPMTSSVPPSSLKVYIITRSGEEDDYFNLTDSNDMATVGQMLTNLNPTSKPDWPLSGYRGYGFRTQSLSSGSVFVHVFAGVITIFDSVGPNYYQDNYGLEDFLDGKSGFVPMEPDDSSMIVEGEDPAPASKLPTSGCEPPYEPNKWNKDPEISQNHCYDYALNTMGKEPSWPGRVGGKEPPLPGEPGYNCGSIIAAAESDGLVKTDCDKACPKCFYKVACSFKPRARQDYHWFRQDDNGNWSHKSAKNAVTDVDSRNNKITDPRRAVVEGYIEFCGCLCVPVKKTTTGDGNSPKDVCPDGE